MTVIGESIGSRTYWPYYTHCFQQENHDGQRLLPFGLSQPDEFSDPSDMPSLLHMAIQRVLTSCRRQGVALLVA